MTSIRFFFSCYVDQSNKYIQTYCGHPVVFILPLPERLPHWLAEPGPPRVADPIRASSPKGMTRPLFSREEGKRQGPRLNQSRLRANPATSSQNSARPSLTRSGGRPRIHGRLHPTVLIHGQVHDFCRVLSQGLDDCRNPAPTPLLLRPRA